MRKNLGKFWWVDRWRKSTAYTDMSVEERGAYRELLDELTLRNGVIPADDRILERIVGDHEAWKRVRKVVLARFTLTPEGYRNDTHDEIEMGSKAFAEMQAKKGRNRAAQASREPAGKFASANQGPAEHPAETPAGKPAETPAETPAASQPPIQPSVSVSVSVNRKQLTETDQGRSVAVEAGTETPNGTPVKRPDGKARKLTPQALGIRTIPQAYSQVELAHMVTRTADWLRRNRPTIDPLAVLQDASTTADGKRIETFDLRRIPEAWAKVTTDRLIKLVRDEYGFDITAEDAIDRVIANRLAQPGPVVMVTPRLSPEDALPEPPEKSLTCPMCERGPLTALPDGTYLCPDPDRIGCDWSGEINAA